jgi:hypothetical protein
MKTLGQIAFEAYKAHRQGIAYDGNPLPAWEEINAGVRSGWEAAAGAVAKQVKDPRQAHTDDPRETKPL